jgi:hypothetical protein
MIPAFSLQKSRLLSEGENANPDLLVVKRIIVPFLKPFVQILISFFFLC